VYSIEADTPKAPKKIGKVTPRAGFQQAVGGADQFLAQPVSLAAGVAGVALTGIGSFCHR
jgi:hypothetical protein